MRYFCKEMQNSWTKKTRKAERVTVFCLKQNSTFKVKTYIFLTTMLFESKRIDTQNILHKMNFISMGDIIYIFHLFNFTEVQEINDCCIHWFLQVILQQGIFFSYKQQTEMQ